MKQPSLTFIWVLCVRVVWGEATSYKNKKSILISVTTVVKKAIQNKKDLDFIM